MTSEVMADHGATAQSGCMYTQPTGVGPLLRAWRTTRGKSQLALSLEAGISSRHLSYVETGRSNPSREMVLTLAETLDVPLRERNALLEAAGFAAVYRETSLDADSMEETRRTLEQLLRSCEPTPAVVVNRRYDLVLANDAARRLVARFSASPPDGSRPPNLARLIVSPDALRPFIENWDEVAIYVVERMRRELGGAPSRDADDEALLAELVAATAPAKRATVSAPLGPALPVKLRRGDLALRLFTAIMTLGTPLDVTLQELRIEMLLPADAATQSALQRLSKSA